MEDKYNEDFALIICYLICVIFCSLIAVTLNHGYGQEWCFFAGASVFASVAVIPFINGLMVGLYLIAFAVWIAGNVAQFLIGVCETVSQVLLSV